MSGKSSRALRRHFDILFILATTEDLDPIQKGIELYYKGMLQRKRKSMILYTNEKQNETAARTPFCSHLLRQRDAVCHHLTCFQVSAGNVKG
jgi:hypothetical protein